MLDALLNRQLRQDNWSRLQLRQTVMFPSSQMVKRLSLYRFLEGHVGCVNSVLFSEDGSLVITGSDDTDINFYDVHTGQRRLCLPTIHTNNIFFAKDVPFSNCEQILSCAADGRVVLISGAFGSFADLNTKELHRHLGRAHRLKLHPTNPHEFYSSGEDGCLMAYDLRSSETPNKVTTFRDEMRLIAPIYVLGVNPHRPYEVALGGGQSFAKIYDTRAGKQEVCSLCPDHLINGNGEYTITGLQYNYSGECLLLSYNDEDIYMMDPLVHNAISKENLSPKSPDSSDLSKQSFSDDINSDSGCANSYIRKFSGHRNCETVKQVTFMGVRSEWIASGSDCGHVFIWDSRSGDVVKLLHADDSGAINCLTPHPNMPLLATSGLDDTAKLWAPIGNRTSLLAFNEISSPEGFESNKDDDNDADDEQYISSVIQSNIEERQYLEMAEVPSVFSFFQLMQFHCLRSSSESDSDSESDSSSNSSGSSGGICSNDNDNDGSSRSDVCSSSSSSSSSSNNNNNNNSSSSSNSSLNFENGSSRGGTSRRRQSVFCDEDDQQLINPSFSILDTQNFSSESFEGPVDARKTTDGKNSSDSSDEEFEEVGQHNSCSNKKKRKLST